MTTNDVINRHNYVTKIKLKSDSAELSKALKIKIMKMRIEYSKIRKQFDEDTQAFIQETITDEFKELSNKQRNEEEETRFKELDAKFTRDLNLYAIERSKDEVVVNDYTFNDEELGELIEVNADNNVEINNIKLSAADFLEGLYILFGE